MAKCIIFCAAEFDKLIQPPEKEDIVIAADSGLKHVLALGLKPDVILGDFDSLGYVPEGANVFPVEKDDTDAMLAIRHGLQLGYREFLLYGCMGGSRLDHTVANFQALQYLADNGARGWLVGLEHLVTVIKEEKLLFPETAEGILSVFCLGPDACGVNLENLQYPLVNGVLTSGFPLGVSNHFVGGKAAVSVEKGSLLVLWDRKNGIPECMAL